MLSESNAVAGRDGPMTDAMMQHGDSEPAREGGQGGGSGGPARRPAPSVAGMVPVADKLTSLAHDLNNLLDGSMRQLALARRSLDAELSAVAGEDLESVRQHVDTAYHAMERMCDLLHAALSGAASGVGSPTMVRGRAISLAEAAEHALAVVAPMALDASARLERRIDPAAGQVPAGAVYPLILNALRNAVESVQRGGRGGVVELAVAVSSQDAGPPMVTLEVRDSGAGLDASLPPARVFEPGVSSKPGGFGLGLAISAEVVRELGGTVELVPMREGGALLRACYPVPQDRGAQQIG